ncbi:MAG: hypothetical protein V1874_03605 [Spirochaetota bacterium]
MKKILFLLFITTAINVHADDLSKFTILDYYKNAESIIKQRYYPIFLKDSKYKFKTTMGYEDYATVDIKNGFIEIKDGGTGASSYVTELALFIDKKNNHFIAINIYDQGEGFTSTLQFGIYTFNGKQWYDITLNKIPILPIEEFYSNSKQNNFYKIRREIASTFKLDNFYYKLPREGLNITVQVCDKCLHFANRIYQDRDFINISNTLDNIGMKEFEKILFQWNSNKSKFELTNKEKFIPFNQKNK